MITVHFERDGLGTREERWSEDLDQCISRARARFLADNRVIGVVIFDSKGGLHWSLRRPPKIQGR
jgi:hypothetical protein